MRLIHSLIEDVAFPVAGKEFTEVAIQDEGGDPTSALYEENKIKTPGTRHSRRSKSTLAPVEEFEDFEDAYDLSDEQSWVGLVVVNGGKF